MLPKTGSIYCCSECGCVDILGALEVFVNRFLDPDINIKTSAIISGQLDILDCYCPDCEGWGPICHVDVETMACNANSGNQRDHHGVHSDLKLHEFIPPGDR